MCVHLLCCSAESKGNQSLHVAQLLPREDRLNVRLRGRVFCEWGAQTDALFFHLPSGSAPTFRHSLSVVHVSRRFLAGNAEYYQE